jgi:hypothetical protein
MTSTLINIDIEEMCNCLGWAIQKHILFGQKVELLQDQSPPSLRCNPLKSKPAEVIEKTPFLDSYEN